MKGTTTSSASLGLTALTSTDFIENSNVFSVQTTITKATSTLQTYAASYGSNLSVVQNRQDFSKNLINILQKAAAT